MKKSRLSLFITCFMLGGTPLSAAKHDININYWFVGATEEHTLFHFIDSSTITYDGPTRSAWVTTIAAGKGVAKYAMRRRMSLIIYDCNRNFLFESRVVTYDDRGVVLFDHSYEDSDFHKIMPGTVDATETGFVCTNPENWTSGQNWTRISVTPEIMSDADNKTFQSHQTP